MPTAWPGERRASAGPASQALLARDVGDELVAGLDPRLAGDDLERAAAGQVVEARGEPGHSEIEIARRHRERDRLRRLEEAQLDFEPFGGEKAAALRR